MSLLVLIALAKYLAAIKDRYGDMVSPCRHPLNKGILSGVNSL